MSSGYSRDSDTTPLLAQSADDDFREFMDTQEQNRRHKLAVRTPFGKIRNIKRLGWAEWILLIIATVSIVSLLATSIERLINMKNSFDNFTDTGDSGANNGTTSDCNSWTCLNHFTYAILLLVNLGFSAFYFYDGLLRDQPLEMIGFAVGIFLIMTFIIIDYALEGNQGDVYRLVRLVLVIILGPQNIVLAFVVQYRMGYLVLNTIGNNQSLTRAYHTRSLLLIIQRFNLQILANVLVLSWAKDGHFLPIVEKVVEPILLGCMIVVSFIGWTAVIWELSGLTVLWSFLYIPNMGFYVYKTVNVAVHWQDYKKQYTEYSINGSSQGTYFIIDASAILVLCGIGLLCVLFTYILMCFSVRNFGRGLKKKLPPPCCKNDDHHKLN